MACANRPRTSGDSSGISGPPAFPEICEKWTKKFPGEQIRSGSYSPRNPFQSRARSARAGSTACSVKTEADATVIHAAQDIILRRVGPREAVGAGAVTHGERRRRIERIAHRQIQLDIVIPLIGTAQVDIGDLADVVVVHLN